ncbi:MAG: hypothetical protein Q8K96_07040 [Rubrivivax sp.]|nr:hypothetical protein [Rubrivivax sp.]
MSNLTLVIDDKLLREARVRALQQGTSVNEICRQAIARFAAPAGESDDFMAQLSALSARISKRGKTLPMWPNRQAMYDEAMAERLPTLWATLDRKPGSAGGRAR